MAINVKHGFFAFWDNPVCSCGGRGFPWSAAFRSRSSIHGCDRVV